MSVTLHVIEESTGGPRVIVAHTWAQGASTRVEPDGIGGLLQVVRDGAGRILGSEIAGLVTSVRVESEP